MYDPYYNIEAQDGQSELENPAFETNFFENSEDFSNFQMKAEVDETFNLINYVEEDLTPEIKIENGALGTNLNVGFESSDEEANTENEQTSVKQEMCSCKNGNCVCSDQTHSHGPPPNTDLEEKLQKPIFLSDMWENIHP